MLELGVRGWGGAGCVGRLLLLKPLARLSIVHIRAHLPGRLLTRLRMLDRQTIKGPVKIHFHGSGDRVDLSNHSPEFSPSEKEKF